MPEVPAIYLKLHARQPVPLREQTFERAVAFFRANPESMDCYVAASGEVLEGEAFRRSCSVIYNPRTDTVTGASRVHSLVSIATIGIPMNVSRTRTDVAAALGEPDWFARRFPEAI